LKNREGAMLCVTRIDGVTEMTVSPSIVLRQRKEQFAELL